MTLPPKFFIPDDEFDKLHRELSRLGFALYLPTTFVTGAVVGGVLASIICGLLYLTGLVGSRIFGIAILVGASSAIMFVQMYAFHGSLSYGSLFIGQAIPLVIGLVLLTPESPISFPSAGTRSYDLISILTLVGFLLWVGGLAQLSVLQFLIDIQKHILRAIHRVPILKAG